MLCALEKRLEESRELTEEKVARFFKTSPGEYSEKDRFLGIRVPVLREIGKKFADLSYSDIQTLLKSPFNEKRFLALIILVNRYQKKEGEREKIYRFYFRHRKFVNNWNLVDASAHTILGAYLFDKDKGVLLELAQSKNMWDRRIAMVATWYFIAKGKMDWTYQLTKLFFDDPHDLIHKATGWMLREAGKKDEKRLIEFLTENKERLPRTTLRYAIERLSLKTKKTLMKK